MKNLFFIFLIVLGLQSSAQIKPAKAGTTYGKATSEKGALTVEELEIKLSANSKYTGKVQGTVVSVCKAEGCWMKLKQQAGNDIMIKFKNHSFFVPKNIMGKNVVLNGVAIKTTTSVEMLKHYAEDAGKSKEEIEKINTPKNEIEFIANGVLVI